MNLIYSYTGWPRKNATTLIINFKDIVNQTDFFFFYYVENSFSNKLTPWPLILGEAFGYKGYFSKAMSFSKFATFSTLAILGTARIFCFTASRRVICCIMNSSVCSYCLRFQSKGSVSVRDAVRWEFCFVPKYDGVEKLQHFKNDIASLK